MKKYHSLELVKNHRFVKKFLLLSFVFFFVLNALMFLPWQQTAKGIGKVIALDPTERDYKISATIDGFLEKIYIKENQFVLKGEPLFTMRDLDKELAYRLQNIYDASSQQSINIKNKILNITQNINHENNILAITQDSYKKNILQYKNSYMALVEQEKSFLNDAKLKQLNYERSKSLYSDGIVSTLELDTKKNEYIFSKANHKKLQIKMKNQLQKIEITKNELQNFILGTQQKINNLKIMQNNAKNELQKLEQKLEQNALAIQRYGTRTIRAKKDGYVVQIYLNDTNRLIKKGENILYFSPIVTQRAIRLEVSDFVMPLVKKGLKARIMFYGWPAMQVSGWPKISHGTYGGKVASVERVSYEKGKYYALIVEDPEDVPWPKYKMLKMGTQASLWIQFGVVPIWYELWRLIVAQPPVMIHREDMTMVLGK